MLPHPSACTQHYLQPKLINVPPASRLPFPIHDIHSPHSRILAENSTHRLFSNQEVEELPPTVNTCVPIRQLHSSQSLIL